MIILYQNLVQFTEVREVQEAIMYSITKPQNCINPPKLHNFENVKFPYRIPGGQGTHDGLSVSPSMTRATALTTLTAGPWSGGKKGHADNETKPDVFTKLSAHKQKTDTREAERQKIKSK